jgi:hypothetical protein
MKKYLSIILLFITVNSFGQLETVDNIIKEATENSQLEHLAHELLDVIGPRLVGTPQMNHGEFLLDFISGANGEDGKEFLLKSIWFILETGV